MMPSDRLVLALAGTYPLAPPPNRPSPPNRITTGDRSRARTWMRGFRRQLDLALREHAGPWIPRITARYPY